MNPSRTRDYTPLYMIGAMCLMWALLHTVLGTSFFGPTPYNTYTRQALAWRQGLLHLPEDVPHLELAIFEGEYYVSFPPLPSVILLPLTYLFGMATPDAMPSAMETSGEPQPIFHSSSSVKLPLPNIRNEAPAPSASVRPAEI